MILFPLDLRPERLTTKQMFDTIKQNGKIAAKQRVSAMTKKKRELPADAGEEAKRQAVLQAILRYAYPSEEEARQAGENLLNALGSFDGVFAVSEEALREIPGVGEQGARLLRLIVEASQLYLEERSWNLLRVYDSASAAEMFRPKFLGRKTEAVCLMLLDGRGRIIFNDVICEGSFSEVPLHLRKLLRLCIDYQSDTVYLAHNHPSGMAVPSPNDLVVTDRLMVALQGISAELCDHLIFAGDSHFSFAEAGLLERQKNILRQAQEDETEAVRRLEHLLTGN